MPVLFNPIPRQARRLRPARCRAMLLVTLCACAGVHATAIDQDGAGQAHAHALKDHRHDHVEVVAEQPDAIAALLRSGHQWAPDAPLQEGMARVREALDHFETTAADGQAAATLGAETQAAVDHIFANCRLAPAADADLHVLLAELLAGSAALADGRMAEGHERTSRAHAAYASIFIPLR